MEIVLGIALIVLLFIIGLLGYLLWIEESKRLSERETNRIERERLIGDHVRSRELLADAFDRDRMALVDKILKSRGVAPINEERKPPQPPPPIESNLTRNKKLKNSLQGHTMPENVRKTL